MPQYRAVIAHLPSKRLVASYLLDWIIIGAIAAIGGGWGTIAGYHRPFSLVDLSISFPHVTHQLVPTWLLVLVCAVVPAAIIALLCLLLVPDSAASSATPAAKVWKKKIWEWNAGWMGLALSLATAYMIIEGMKNIFGKPRPDLLARCKPDLSRLRTSMVTNGYGDDVSARWVLVSSAICTQSDHGVLDDGFRSFPSGHAAISWAGLLYLSLFLASKFHLAFPQLLHHHHHHHLFFSATNPATPPLLPMHHQQSTTTTPSSPSSPPRARKPTTSTSTPAPPLYVLAPFLLPLAVAVYISATRYTDFRHHGIDILAGSAIGITCAGCGFRTYQAGPGDGGAAWRGRRPGALWWRWWRWAGAGAGAGAEPPRRRRRDDDEEVGGAGSAVPVSRQARAAAASHRPAMRMAAPPPRMEAEHVDGNDGRMATEAEGQEEDVAKETGA